MGCGACRVIFEENTDSPLDYNLKKLLQSDWVKDSEVEMMNSLYENASETIKLIEDMRYTIKDNLDNLILNTGAFVFINPDIALCIKCVLWKISANYEGEISKSLETDIRLIDDDPYIKIAGYSKLREDTRYVINLLMHYIMQLFSLKVQIKKIEGRIPQLVYILSENNGRYLLGRKNMNADKDEEEQDNLTNLTNGRKTTELFKRQNLIMNLVQINNNKIKKAIDVYPDLVKEHNIYEEKTKYEFALLKKKTEYKNNIDKVGLEAFSKEITDICQIAFLSKDVLSRKNVELELDEKASESDDNDVYVKSVSEGKKKYEEIIEGKRFLKEKRNKQ